MAEHALFTWLITHLSRDRNPIKKLLEPINEFSEVEEHEIYIQNAVLFYTLAMNKLKMKIRKQFNSTYTSTKKNKIHRSKFGMQNIP